MGVRQCRALERALLPAILNAANCFACLKVQTRTRGDTDLSSEEKAKTTASFRNNRLSVTHWLDFSAVTSAFSNRNYAIYIFGGTLSMNGFWMHRVAVGWLAWQLTGSALWLGIIAFADLIPALLIGPIAGAFADRHSRLQINIVCQFLAMIQALILWFLTASDIITINLLLALTLLLAFVLAFNQPARMSLVPSLVRPSDITAAIAVNSVSFNLARFIGPAVAGIVITTMGIAPAFLINALTFVIFIIAMFQLRLPPQKMAQRAAGGIFADILQGFRYAAVHPAIGPLLLIMTATSILAAPVLELLPGFADAVFGRDAVGLAWLTSASGIGATIGGIWLAKRGTLTGLTALMLLGGTLVLGVMVVLFTSTTTFWVGVIAMVFVGFARLIGGVAGQTLVQSTVEEHLRARVMGIYGLIFRGGPALGALIMGGLSDLMGFRAPIAIGGILCILLWFVVQRRQKSLAGLLEPTTGTSDQGEAVAR